MEALIDLSSRKMHNSPGTLKMLWLHMSETEPNPSPFCIKAMYRHRSQAEPSASIVQPNGLNCQPDVHLLARFLAGRFEADTILDIGARSVRQFAAADFGPYSELDRRDVSHERLIELDIADVTTLDVMSDILCRSIVICAGVIERLADPTRMLNLLRSIRSHALAVIITTPERDLLHGPHDMGPPADPNRLREWNISEFEQLLVEHDLRPTFIGLTVTMDVIQKNTIICILDHCSLAGGRDPPDSFCPLALVATYNDVDIATQIVAKFLDERIEVLVQDNWSTDGTFECLTALAASRDNLIVERFPENGATPYFDLRTICRSKEEIAAKNPGRWIIHHDSDEIRCSPWRDVSLRGGLFVADQMGFNAIDFTVCEFRPVDQSHVPHTDLEQYVRHFEFSRERSHFTQIKAWRQGVERVNLSCTAGHQVQFSGRRIFPYKFLLKHYPLRSAEQARRKVTERRARYSLEEIELGWHHHYNQLRLDDRFLWDAAGLISFDEHGTRRNYLLESIAGIGIIREVALMADANAQKVARSVSTGQIDPGASLE